MLDFFRNNPKANRSEAAKQIGNITEDGVKFIISRLQELELLKRDGGRKAIHGWSLIINRNNLMKVMYDKFVTPYFAFHANTINRHQAGGDLRESSNYGHTLPWAAA